MRLFTLLLLLLTGTGAAAQPVLFAFSARSPNSQGGGFFGAYLEPIADVDGDGVTDLIVGAPFENGSRGRVYILSGTDGSPLLEIDTPEPTVAGFFGVSVADAGDLDGDGTHDVYAAGYFAVDGAASAGRVTAFSGTSGAVIRTVTSPNAQENGFFGFNIATPGDLDGDGETDLVVAAGDEDIVIGGTSVEDHGAVYAFSGATGAALWTSTPQTQESLLYYGRVAPLGDVTGDGVPDLLTSAVLADDSNGIESGLAYLVDGTDGAILRTFESGNAQGNGFFGNTLTGLGDITGDGTPDFAVGAPFEGVGGTDVRDGTVTFFDGASGQSLGTYAREQRQANRLFGWAVAPLGDLTGDGITEIGISATQQFNGPEALPPPFTAPFSGALFVSSGADIGQMIVADLADIYPSLPDFPVDFSWGYGYDLAPLGDFDGDGAPDVAVGVPSQGTEIGFVGFLPGDRIVATSEASVLDEEEQTVGADGTYDFGATGVDITFTGVQTLRPERSGTEGATGEGGAGRTGRGLVRIEEALATAARGGGVTVRVQRRVGSPTDIDGIAESNVSTYRWVLTKDGALGFGSSSEIRFRLSEIPGAGVTSPETVVAYQRPTLGGGTFTALTTTYDSGTGEIVATGFSRIGEFAFASNDNPLPAEPGAERPALTLAVAPNPAGSEASVSLHLAETGPVRLAVIDALGREAAHLHDGPVAAGHTAFAVPVASLPPGVYLLRAETATGVATERLTVAR